MADEAIQKYNDQDLQVFLHVATELAIGAGEIMKSAMGKTKTIAIKEFNATECNASSVLTETDEAVEKLIVDGLSAKFPNHRFIGEEGVGSSTEGKGLPMNAFTNSPTWIIDPIDGTMNFVHNNPLVVTSIGLAINKKLVLGIINAPIIGKLYTAIEGKGALLNGEPIRVSGVKSLGEAMVIMEMCTGGQKSRRENTLTNLNSLMAKAHSVRSPGPAALDLAWVGGGSADAFFHCGLHCWDMAAGAVIIREAGGVVLSLDGGEPDLMGRTVLAASSMELALELAATVEQFPVDPEYPLRCPF